MQNKWLHEGDIIRLKKGMNVRTKITECVYNEEKPFSIEEIQGIIEIGKIYRSKQLSRNELIEKMREVLLKEFGTEVPDTKIKYIIDYLPINSKQKEYDSSSLEGEYVVKKAEFLEMRICPYRVICYRKDDPSIVVEFYQKSPRLKNNIKDIKAIGHI